MSISAKVGHCRWHQCHGTDGARDSAGSTRISPLDAKHVLRILAILAFVGSGDFFPIVPRLDAFHLCAVNPQKC